MKGDAQVIEVLNGCLTAELTAINQYFVDAKMCENWGYERLAQRFREDSIDEMRDAEALVDRILYLDGMANLQRLGTVAVGETVAEKLTAALSLEVAAVERLNGGIATCIERGDHGSREVLQAILRGEEEHADWLEAQLGLMAQIGEANYLAQQLRD
ncbi:MAG: bacterioferritin [Actinomycetota bacterium]|nr:bacterioferritin [Actinomycetota bacterium]MDQ3575970.1 bacterioferritin [Actinomycetota bacterium]